MEPLSGLIAMVNHSSTLSRSRIHRTLLISNSNCPTFSLIENLSYFNPSSTFSLIRSRGHSSVEASPIFSLIQTRSFTLKPTHQNPSHFDPLLAWRSLNLLKRCKNTREFMQIHSHMLTNNVQKENFLLAKLVELRDISYAETLFSVLSHPNEFSWNTIIRGLAQNRRFHDVLKFYHKMLESGIKPNNFTYPFVLVSCAGLPDCSYGKRAHSSLHKSGLNSVEFIQHSLITMYSKCGVLQDARKVFDEILERDLVSWNAMISGYAQNQSPYEAIALFRLMRISGLEPDEMTLVSVLAACADSGDMVLGRWIENYAEERGFGLNSFIGSSLIGMYSKCGNLISARKIFDRMSERDVVAWNAMITGYAQNGLSKEAIRLFYEMRERRVGVDKITLVGVLSACAMAGALDLGTWLDQYTLSRGLRKDVYVGTALVDMYAKCGCLDQARSVFSEMRERNVVTWNAMISGLAMHGQGREALSLFTKMREKHVEPNNITFVGVLSACVHVGLVEEGREYFKCMRHEYGIAPQIEHYACMVDLLGRAGLLKEAYRFLTSIPKKPDAVVWGTLLGACKVHRDVDLGERVMGHLLELEPGNSGNYVILYNLYIAAKRWDEAARIRGLMRDKGVQKIPGCSWIEVENTVHEFHVSEDLHPQMEDIYAVLDVLIDQLKLEGYSPNGYIV
ncbi:hypothetical protein AMTRI_Chr01g114100 [Amborella trichopoda]